MENTGSSSTTRLQANFRKITQYSFGIQSHEEPRSFLSLVASDGSIEELVRSCSVYQELYPSPATAPLRPCQWPDKPWSRFTSILRAPSQVNAFGTSGRPIKVDGGGSDVRYYIISND